MQMLRKRYAGDAWLLLTEVANGTGANTKRHADALAIGTWPSRGMPIEGIEIKISRGDVQRELAQPEKADAVGQFCDRWWLVISELSIIDGLVIPETWGVLVPKQGVLREHITAPKRKPKPVDRGFMVAILRNMSKSYIARDVHEAFVKDARTTIGEELKRERAWEQRSLTMDLEAAKAKIANFKRDSGIDLDEGNRWELGNIAEAVKVVVEAKKATNRTGHYGNARDAIEMVKGELNIIERLKNQHEAALEGLAASRDRVLELVTRLERMAEPEPPPEAETPNVNDLTSWAQTVAREVGGSDA